MYSLFQEWFEFYTRTIQPLMDKGYSHEDAKVKAFENFNRHFQGISVI